MNLIHFIELIANLKEIEQKNKIRQNMGKPYLAQLKPYKNFYYANRFPRVDNLYAYNTFDRANVHLYTYSLLIVFLYHCEMAELEIQEQLTELQADIEARIEFNQLGSRLDSVNRLTAINLG